MLFAFQFLSNFYVHTYVLTHSIWCILGTQEASRRTRTHQARGAAQETTGNLFEM